MLKKEFLLVILFFIVPFVQSMEQDYHSVLVPGQNGHGCQDFIDFGLCTENPIGLSTLENYTIDLGQGNCVRHFEKELENELTEEQRKKKLLLFGASQGTATLINWLAQKNHLDQESLVGCLFLEATLGNGNNAILHNVEAVAPIVTYLPFARLWIPFLAKILFPTYNPFGKQALSSAKKLSPEIPVIIYHNEFDPELPFSDAQKLYCALAKNRSQNNVYLITANAPGIRPPHINLLHHSNERERARVLAIIQAIYKKHNLPRDNQPLINENIVDSMRLKDYQPDVKTVEQVVRSDSSQRMRTFIDRSCVALCLTGLFSYLYQKGHISSAIEKCIELRKVIL